MEDWEQSATRGVMLISIGVCTWIASTRLSNHGSGLRYSKIELSCIGRHSVGFVPANLRVQLSALLSRTELFDHLRVSLMPICVWGRRMHVQCSQDGAQPIHYLEGIDLRIEHYSNIASMLTALSSQQLEMLLNTAEPLHTGIGGVSSTLWLNDVKLFVKKIPLTMLEQQPENIYTTRNIFNLPLFYQYGVGSVGFGAWRELRVHLMASNWVLAKKCADFPLLYHWRILQRQPIATDISYWSDLDKYKAYWNQSITIHDRLNAINHATSYIVLFIEYVPETLHDWLSHEMSKGGQDASLAAKFVSDKLCAAQEFMQNVGLIHFDLHFKNILTDGRRIYLSDFGLALSSKFDLNIREKAFIDKHKDYDSGCIALNLLNNIITTHYGKENWTDKLKLHLNGTGDLFSDCLEDIIRKYYNAAILMDGFLTTLQNGDKSTPFPDAQLTKALAGSRNG